MGNKTIGIGFGVLSDSISKQLKNQGFDYDKKVVEVFESEMDAINTLRFGNSLLTDSDTDRITKKLYKKIVSHVCRKNKISEIK